MYAVPERCYLARCVSAEQDEALRVTPRGRPLVDGVPRAPSARNTKRATRSKLSTFVTAGVTRKASRTRMMNSNSNEVILPSILQTHSTHHRNTMCVHRGHHQENPPKNSILCNRPVEPGALARCLMTRRHCDNSSFIDQQAPNSLCSAQGERDHKT